MPYAMHIRKSRADIEAELRGEGESLARHRKRLMDLADRLQLDVVEEYCEIISGDKLSERPEMQRLLQDVAAGKYDGVLDVEISRLTRGDMMDQARIINTFKYSGTRIITPEHTYDLAEDWDEDVITTDMMMARREYKFIKRRLQRGRDASASEGLWQGPVPYGYKKVKIQRGKGWTLEPDPETAPFVKMLFELYAQGLGGTQIADKLNALGSRTAKGNLWDANKVRQLSASPVYAGKILWKKRVSTPRLIAGQMVVKRDANPTPILSDGKHPPIVSPETWEAAQRTKQKNNLTRKHTSAPLRSPLVGLVYCAECGHTMIRKDNGNSRGSKYDVLRCATRGCPTVSTELAIVERSILDALHGWLLIPKPQETHADTAHEDAIKAARANLDKLKGQLTRIYAAYEDGAYDTTIFVQRRREKEAAIAEAERAIAALEETPAKSPAEAIAEQLPQIKTVLDLYSLDLTPPERNKLLRSVIQRVEYRKTVRCFRNQSGADTLELVVFPRFAE